MNAKLLTLGGIGFLAILLTGCPARKQVRPAEEPKLEDVQKAQPAEEPSLRGKEYQSVPELRDVYFDLDSATLRADARAALQKNYDAVTAHPDWEILVEGHCDERGTTEYNLALGQRRAAAVRQYYITLGVSGNRIATISYGEENPTCAERTEDCWAQNRRGVTKARSMAAGGGAEAR